MPRSSRQPSPSSRATDLRRKVPRTYRLTPSKVAAAKRILGVATATEAIETALDLVVFRRELVEGTRAMLGTDVTPPDRSSG